MPADLLPSSLPTVRRGGVYSDGKWWSPMFCLNCGKQSPYVTVEAPGNDTYYICDDPCAAQWQAQFDTQLVRDEVHWQLCVDEQLERYGRVLTADEQAEALKQSDHVLSKLARSR